MQQATSKENVSSNVGKNSENTLSLDSKKGVGPDGLHVPMKLEGANIVTLSDIQRLPQPPNRVKATLSDPETMDSWLMVQAWMKKDASDVLSLPHAVEIISKLRTTVVTQFGHDPASVQYLLDQNVEQVVLDASDVHDLGSSQAIIGSLRSKLSNAINAFSELEVIFFNATNLRDTDIVGLSDPYAVARIGEVGSDWEQKSEVTSDGEKPRTPTRGNSLNPSWNCKVQLCDLNRYQQPELHVRIFDHDSFRADNGLGEVTIPLIGMSGYEKDYRLKGTNPLKPSTLRMSWHRRKPKLSQVQYKVIVKTGDRGLAGTDANVHIRIEGENCSTNSFQLENFFRDDNETGDVCEFVSPIVDNVERPLQIHLWHDGEGDSSAWYVDWVVIELAGVRYDFPCHAWIRHPYRPISVLEGEASLPQHDVSRKAAARASSLNRRRMLYRFTTTEGPLGDTTGLIPPYLAHDKEDDKVIDYELHHETESLNMSKQGVDLVVNVGLSALLNSNERYAHIEEWENFFQVPNFIENAGDVRVPLNHLDDWKEDLEFAWQRVAGLNPVMIELLDPEVGLLPPECIVTEEDVKGVLPQGTTLAGELKAGHIFVCDYHSLKNFQGTELEGEMRYTTAPIVLFHADGENGHPLLPIAIQLERPTVFNLKPLVFTPKDTHHDWLAAKMFVQSSDFASHQFRSHALHCHLAQEPIVVAMNRNLSIAHPVWKLLRPHFHGLAPINDLARGVLITQNDPSVENYAGWILGIGAPGTMLYSASQWQTEYSFERYWFKESLKRRGLWENESIGNYPFRDDGLLLFDAIEQYVRGVLGHFYQSDDDVVNDFEVQNWISEMIGVGEVKGLDHILSLDKRLVTFDNLVHLCTNVIFVASAEHAAVNFSQIDFAGHVMNTPAAIYAPPPQKKGITDDAYLVAMMPSKKWTAVQVGILSFLSHKSTDRLGKFQERFFLESKVQAEIDSFLSNLKNVEEEINRRNKSGERKKEYPYLLPGNIPNSTAI